MRNFKRFPITNVEICTALRKQAEEIAKEERIGDMRPILFRTAAKMIERMDFVTWRLEDGMP